MTILLRCVGIYFNNKEIQFLPEPPISTNGSTASGIQYMKGSTVLDMAKEYFNLHSSLKNNYISSLGYTPKPEDMISPKLPTGFPFYGTHLSLKETRVPFNLTSPQPSTVFQYTVTPSKETHVGAKIATSDHHPAFSTNGFPDNCIITIRLVSIILQSHSHS